MLEYKRLVIFLIACASLSSCGSGGDGGCTTSDENGPSNTAFLASAVSVAGANGMNGIFDPAPVEDGSGNLWMSYSTVNFTGSPPLETTRSHIASWNVMTSSWADAGVNLGQDAEIVFQVPDGVGGMLDAIWQYEVSRVLYDANTPNAAERWKVLWHRHLTVNLAGKAERLFQHGWIGLSTAPAITGPWSNEVNLFAGNIYDVSNNVIAGTPRFDVRVNLTGLSACQAFTEPSLISTSNGIYIGLKCATQSGGQTVLLKCNHSLSSCAFQGDLIDDSDAVRFSRTGQSLNGFSATELIQSAGQTYLMVTPTENDNYRGCMVFRVENLETAQLEQDACGRPRASLRIEGLPGSFNGACGYSSASQLNGILYSEFQPGLPQFRVFSSGVSVP